MHLFGRSSKAAIPFRAFVIVICFVVISSLVLFAYDFVEKKHNPRPFEDYVLRYSDEYGVPCEIVYAIMKAESDFDQYAVSRMGACGLMQLMPSTFEWLRDILGAAGEPADIFDAELNIRCGVYYLSRLFDRFDDSTAAIAAYNAGEGTVANWLSDPTLSSDGDTLEIIPYAETKAYCQKVENIRIRYLRLYKTRQK